MPLSAPVIRSASLNGYVELARLVGLNPQAMMRKAGLDVVDERGVVYRVMADSWALSEDMDVNYMMSAARGA